MSLGSKLKSDKLSPPTEPGYPENYELDLMRPNKEQALQFKCLLFLYCFIFSIDNFVASRHQKGIRPVATPGRAFARCLTNCWVTRNDYKATLGRGTGIWIGRAPPPPILTSTVLSFFLSTVRLWIRSLNYHAHRPTQCGCICISPTFHVGSGQLADSR